MTTRVGLIATLDMKDFNAGFAKYMSSLDQLNRETTQTATGIGGHFTSLGDSVLKVGALLGGVVVAGATAATTAITAFAVQGVKAAIDMEQNLANIASVLGLTTQEAQVFKSVILDLGLDPTLKVTADEAAAAIELLARNGVFAGQSLEEMEETARGAGRAVVLLANATGAEFGTAADIATDAMAVFNIGLDEMDDTISSIVSVTTQSKFTIDDFSLALRNGGAAAADLGVSLEEFNAVIASSAEELGTGMRAGTGFRNFLTRLTPNTDKAADAMRELGLVTEDGSNIFFDAAGNLKSMSEITQILNSVLLQERDIVGEVGGRTAEQNRILGELRDQYADATRTIADYESGVKGITLTDDERNERIEKQRELLELLAPKIAELEGVRGDLITTTSRLTDEERSMALETIFGADALGTVIALANEGGPAFGSAAEAAEVLGISMHEAREFMDSGATSFDLLMRQMAQVDAASAAETRMDTLAGSLEILEGIIDTVKLQVGDVFIPALRDLTNVLIGVADQAGPKVVAFFQTLSDTIGAFLGALREGQGPLDGLVAALQVLNVPETTVTSITNFISGIQELVSSIGEFVGQHSEAFMGALEGIGILLGSAGVISGITKLISLIRLLAGAVNPLVLVAAAIGAAWNTNFGGIRDIVNNVVTTIVDFVSEIESVEDVVARVGEFLGIDLVSDFEAFKTFLAETGTAIAETFSPIVERVTEIIGAIGSAFSEGGFVGAIEEFKTLWPDISEVIGNALQGAVSLVEQVLGVDITTPFNNFVGFISGVSSDIEGPLQEVKDAFLENFAPTIEIVSGTVSEIRSLLAEGGISGLVSGWGDVWEKIASIPGSALDDAVNSLINLINESFGIDIIAGFESIITEITEVWGRISPIFISIGEVLGPTLGETIGQLGETITGMIPNLDAFSQIWQSLQELFVTLQPVLEVAGQILRGIFLVGLGLVTGLVNGLAQALNPLIMALGFLAELVSTTIANAFTVFVDIIQVIAAAIQGLVTGDFTALQEAWSELTTDFIQAATDFVTNFVGLIATLGITVWELVSGLVEGIIGFFTNLYDQLVGNSIIPDMVNGIIEWVVSLKDQFLLFVLELVTAVITNFTTFVGTVLETISTWVLNIVAKVLELKDDFILYVGELWTTVSENFTTKIGEIFEAFSTWVLDLIDKAVTLKDDTVQAVTELWESFVDLVTTNTASILETIVEWVTGLIEEAITLKDDVIDAVVELWDTFVETVEGGVTDVWEFFTGLVQDVINLFTSDTDWGSLGRAIIDGLVQSIQNGIATVTGVVQGLVNSVVDAANTALGIESPSRVFAAIGQATVDGFIDGWEQNAPDAVDTVIDLFDGISQISQDAISNIHDVLSELDIEGALNFANAFESLGSGAIRALKSRVIDPLKDQTNSLDDEIGDLLDFASDEVRQIFEFGGGAALKTAAQLGSFRDEGSMQHRIIQELIDLDSERLGIAEKIAAEEEKIAAFKKQQQDLAFLEQQLKLLDFIAEQGLDPSEILGGLQLGVNADAAAIVEAMTQAMQMAIMAAEETLQISSPSRVFENIGEQTMAGFIEGLTSTTSQVFGTMQTFTNDMIGAMTPTQPSTISNTTDRSLTLEVHNDFTGEPQITDVSELEFLLAGIQ